MCLERTVKVTLSTQRENGPSSAPDAISKERLSLPIATLQSSPFSPRHHDSRTMGPMSSNADRALTDTTLLTTSNIFTSHEKGLVIQPFHLGLTHTSRAMSKHYAQAGRLLSTHPLLVPDIQPQSTTCPLRPIPVAQGARQHGVCCLVIK